MVATVFSFAGEIVQVTPSCFLITKGHSGKEHWSFPSKSLNSECSVIGGKMRMGKVSV